MVVRQDEAAGAGLRRNLRRDRAHAGRQDRGHEAGALGVDQLGLADRLAARRRARARSSPASSSIAFGPVALADEIAGRRRSPARPAIAISPAVERLAHADVGFRDQDVDRVELGRGGRLDLRRLLRSAREHRGDAAGAEGDDQDDKTRGFHTLTLKAHRAAALAAHSTWRRTRPLARISAGNGQGMVKQRYLNRVNDVLPLPRALLRDRMPTSSRSGIDGERRRRERDAVRHAAGLVVQALDPFLPRQ